jgi:hypothetical protein
LASSSGFAAGSVPSEDRANIPSPSVFGGEVELVICVLLKLVSTLHHRLAHNAAEAHAPPPISWRTHLFRPADVMAGRT